MATPGTYAALLEAKTIGAKNLAAWSSGFDPNRYLSVLPHPQITLPINDSWIQWQQGNSQHNQGIYSSTSPNGSYYSSWGPSKSLDVTLRMSTLDQITIKGLGTIRANKGKTTFDSVYDSSFWTYNNQTPGPLLVANPGDTINIHLINDLTIEARIEEENPHAYETNLHGHGLHVSPSGNSDNALLTLNPGESWDVSWDLPEDHLVGLNWSHPHYHGATSLSIAKGLAFPLLVLPDKEQAPNLDQYDPTQQKFFLLTLQSWALSQEQRASSPTDPLNQDPTGQSWPIGTPPKIFSDSQGDYYQYSPARFNGNNYYPIDKYNPAKPSTYGDAVGLAPNENIITTASGYYNPTLDINTGKWATFMFENVSLNSSHVIQLIRRDDNGQLTLENPNILGTDGDISLWASPYDTRINELPLLIPGGRVAVQHAFKKPGEYFFLSNASTEVLGSLAPKLSNFPQGNGNTYLGVNDGFQITPSQVLATVRVAGNEVQAVDTRPLPWSDLVAQYSKSQLRRKEIATKGVEQERTFDWISNAPVGKEYNDPSTWEGTWTINGQYWTHSPTVQPTLTTVMLDTVERWHVRNLSGGRTTTNLSGQETYKVSGQSHPFHIHVNEFLIESINGLTGAADPTLTQTGDSFYSTYIDNLTLGPRYIKGTATADNPYGTPGFSGQADEAFTANLLLEFKDFPGMFVDHCHLLFHEDGGMMVPVQTILNTNSSWLVSDSTDSTGNIKISLASDTGQSLRFKPYNGKDNSGSNGIVVASGDINADPTLFKPGEFGQTINVTDNVADIATIQKRISPKGQAFTIEIFDGAGLKRAWNSEISSNATTASNQVLPLSTIQPFQNQTFDRTATTDLAIGDVDGDGYADIVASLGSEKTKGLVEIYSGKDNQLLATLNPFAANKYSTAINLSVGDINADGFADILTGQGSGGNGLVQAFSGVKIYKALQSGTSDSLTGISLTDSVEMIGGIFQPYGQNYRGSVDVAASYILPRGFEANQIHQSLYANITTLAVGRQSTNLNPSVRNFLYLGEPMDHDMMSMDHASMDTMSSKASSQYVLPDSIAYSSSIKVKGASKGIQTQYIDWSSDQRGEATLLLTPQFGNQQLVYLPDTTMQSGEWNILSGQTKAWHPSRLS